MYVSVNGQRTKVQSEIFVLVLLVDQKVCLRSSGHFIESSTWEGGKRLGGSEKCNDHSILRKSG